MILTEDTWESYSAINSDKFEMCFHQYYIMNALSQQHTLDFLFTSYKMRQWATVFTFISW
jgi:hypothetical protein